MDHPGNPAEDAQQDVQGDLRGAAVFGDDGQWGEEDGYKWSTRSIEGSEEEISACMICSLPTMRLSRDVPAM
jgi:hypothetical protein